MEYEKNFSCAFYIVETYLEQIIHAFNISEEGIVEKYLTDFMSSVKMLNTDKKI